MIKRDLAKVKQQAARLRTAAAVRQSARRMSAVWATGERPGKGGGRDFPGFGK